LRTQSYAAKSTPPLRTRSVARGDAARRSTNASSAARRKSSSVGRHPCVPSSATRGKCSPPASRGSVDSQQHLEGVAQWTLASRLRQARAPVETCPPFCSWPSRSSALPRAVHATARVCRTRPPL
jgi:hypothetical protein